jgi:tyrosinase
MARISRRSFVAAGAAGATLNAIPFSEWIGRRAYAQGVRVRHSAYSPQGKAMLVKYETAVKRMMDHAQVPEGDPRSWTFQWYTHFTPPPGKQSELNRIYPQPNAPHRALAQEMWNTCQAHNGQPEDYFLPWHRMFVYFFEEIIREMAQDPGFTLPYWNYSNPADAAIPPEFRVAGSPLYRANRNPGVNTGSKIPANQVALTALKEKVYSQNGADQGFCATLDFGLHGNVHVWVGNGTNMGSVPWAARDPIFWMHHCNIDRLWASWNRGGCKDPPEGSFRDKQFVFADPKGQKVVATVKDFEDIEKQLRYTYDAFERASCPPLVAKLNPFVLATIAAPTTLVTRTPLRVRLAPPPRPTGGGPASSLSQQLKALEPTKSIYLVLEDVHAAAPVNAHYDVYLDLPEGAAPNPESPNYVGTINFFGVTMGPDMEAMKPRSFSLDVTDKAKALDLSESPAVTLAPSGEPSEEAKPTIGKVQLAVQ